VATFQTAREVILLALLVAAAYTDLASGKVYNWCSLPALFLGLLLAYVTGGVTEGAADGGAGAANLVDGLLGLAAAGGVFGLFALCGAFGFGDVKLAAAIGALKGWRFAITAIGFSALVGGLMALALLVWKGQLWRGLRDSLRAVVRPGKAAQRLGEESPARLTIPYGLAISIGTLWAWFGIYVFPALRGQG
jgi:prepilin peptidase CpaA